MSKYTFEIANTLGQVRIQHIAAANIEDAGAEMQAGMNTLEVSILVNHNDQELKLKQILSRADYFGLGSFEKAKAAYLANPGIYDFSDFKEEAVLFLDTYVAELARLSRWN